MGSKIWQWFLQQIILHAQSFFWLNQGAKVFWLCNDHAGGDNSVLSISTALLIVLSFGPESCCDWRSCTEQRSFWFFSNRCYSDNKKKFLKDYYFWFNKYTKLPFRGSVSNQNVVNSYFTLLPSEKLIWSFFLRKKLPWCSANTTFLRQKLLLCPPPPPPRPLHCACWLLSEIF